MLVDCEAEVGGAGGHLLMLLDAHNDVLAPNSLLSGLWPRQKVCKLSAVFVLKPGFL